MSGVRTLLHPYARAEAGTRKELIFSPYGSSGSKPFGEPAWWATLLVKHTRGGFVGDLSLIHI